MHRRRTRNSTTHLGKPQASAAPLSNLGGPARSTRSRQAFKDITNNGRVRQFSKSKKPVATKKRLAPADTLKAAPANPRDGRSFKKRRSVPDSDEHVDRMEVDDVEIVPDWENIDLDEAGVVDPDPLAVTEYVDEIHQYMRQLEPRYMIDARYMASQVDINERMRAILFDWLVEVHRMFKLLPETLFLSVNIIDRYLESKAVARNKLQLAGITAMLIASKYEEIYAPECNDFVYISDGTYSKDEILQMEQNILATLQFNLNGPSPLHFLRRFSKAAHSGYQVHALSKYLVELTILDIKLLKYRPSHIAAGAVYIARKMLVRDQPTWNATIEHYTELSEEAVRQVATDMNVLLNKSQKSNMKAIKKKYNTAKFHNVSSIPPLPQL